MAEKTQKRSKTLGDRSSRRIDTVIRDLDILLRRRLLPGLTSGGIADRRLLDEIEAFLETEQYRNFQWDDLRVYGGAFGLAHQSRRDFILLQSPNYVPEELLPLRAIEIPYLPDTHAQKDYKDLIDYLFIGRRSRQPLSGDKETEFAPEFFWHLAQVYYAKPTESRQLHMHKLFRVSHFEKYLQNVQKAPYLYCPIGEVSFFLYAWRLLLRHCQQSGDLAGPLGPKHNFASNEGVDHDLWDDAFWEKQRLSVQEWRSARALPEWGWMSALRDLKESGDAGIAHRQFAHFRKAVVEQWELWRRRLDVDESPAAEFRPWFSDWVNLSLLKLRGARSNSQTRPTHSLLSLILFASNVERRTSAKADLLEKARIIKDAIEDHAAIDHKTLAEVDHQLQDVVCRLLRPRKVRTASILSMLRTLHRIARFPILPFFYWTAIDRRPKEHFVFPVWESWQFPVEVKVPVDILKGKRTAKEYILPSVGIGLFTIEPEEYLSVAAYDDNFQFSRQADPTEAKKEYEKVYEECHKRLAQIARLFRHLSHPLIESAFYGNLVRDSIRRQENLRTRSDLAATFSHAYQKRATMFVNSFGEFLNRTLALDLAVNTATGRSSTPVVNEFYRTGRIEDEPGGMPYGQITDFDPPRRIERSDLLFAFDHREALEWYKTDIDTFYRISRFDRTFSLDKFREPKSQEPKSYLYLLSLVKFIESIVILKYQGTGAEQSAYETIFQGYQSGKEWSYLLIKGAENLKQNARNDLAVIEKIITAPDFPVRFACAQEEVRDPKRYLRIFDNAADEATRSQEQDLLVEVLGKVIGEIFLNALQGMKELGNSNQTERHISLEFIRMKSGTYLDISTSCGDEDLLEKLTTKFERPGKPEYTQGGWGRYGNLVIMRDYLSGNYLEKKTTTRDQTSTHRSHNGVVTRLELPAALLGKDSA